ncbi:MAG: AbrB/MazE/SpoVT family DNA-binding domain-containing protein [Spirochaetia bacterium]|nr:AbrB/MazE/SpoVT family DNA-binding domain-containing protein [Spirochaetia bacterium]
MKTTVEKWENGLGIRIPLSYARQLNLEEGTVVEISQNRKGILVLLKQKPRRDELEELLSLITPENMHSEDFFGKEIGNEIG